MIARVLDDGKSLERLFPLVGDETGAGAPEGPGGDPSPRSGRPPLAKPGSIIQGRKDPEDEAPSGPWTLLAEGGSARAELYALCFHLGIDPLYPKAVHDEIARHEGAPGIDDPSLEDLTALPFVTIDNPDSKDLDQALQIEALPDDGYRLRYALADASHYAPPRSALFREALRRGVSTYLPGMTIPMLPPELSEGLVSLNPDVERRALVMELDLNREGQCTKRGIHRARIRSRAKLSYEGVQAFHDDPAASPLSNRPFTESLILLGRLGRLRQAEARTRHVVRYDRLEQRVDLDESDGTRFVLREESRCEVDGWNEQISLLCNCQGAILLAEGLGVDPHLQPIFRIHEAPDPRALDHLRHMLAAMARAHGLDGTLWTWPGKEPLADFLERLPRDPSHAALRQAAQRQILLSNRRASYTPEPGRHHGLALEPYVRFTAPMREVVGIFTHKEALEHLGLCPPRPDRADEALRLEVIEAAHRGQERQRSIEKAVLQLAVDGFLRHDCESPLARRPRHEGIVLGLKDGRAYVRLRHPPVDLKLSLDHLGELAGETIRVSEDGATLLRGGDDRPWLRMGDPIELVTMGREKGRGKWLLAPMELVASRDVP